MYGFNDKHDVQGALDSNNFGDIASAANDKFDQANMARELGQSQLSTDLMEQAKDLASHIPHDQASSSNLNPMLNPYAGTAKGGNSGGNNDRGNTEL